MQCGVSLAFPSPNVSDFLLSHRTKYAVRYFAKSFQAVQVRAFLMVDFSARYVGVEPRSLLKIDWKPLVIHPKTLEMIGRMTSRTLVGLELSRDPVWHEALMGYAGSIFEASVKLKVIPSIIRPIYALFMPLLWKIRRCKWNARKILFPEIQRRRAEREGGPAVQSKERVSDLLDWLDDVSKGDELLPESILKRELALGFGAIHTTTNHTVNVILDLAARWEEYAPALREEIEEAMKEDDGEIRKATFTKLSKLDSFMKESQRMNPLSSGMLPSHFT